MLTGRQSKLLEILLNNVQGMTGQQLSERLDVSSRTIRNEIGEINRVWKDGSIIKASRRTGYFIEEIHRDSVREYFLLKNDIQTEEISTDRGWIILGFVLKVGNTDIFEIAEILSLSEQAVHKEIVKFQKKMQADYQYEFLKMSGERVWLKEDERKIRQTLFRIIKNEVQSSLKLYFGFLSAVLYSDYDKEEYEWMVRLIKEYFDSKRVQISDANLQIIASAVNITLVRNEQNHRLSFRKETEKEELAAEILEFFAYLKEQKVELRDDDLTILGELLHSFNLTANPVEDRNIDEVSVLILDEFCNSVMEKYHFDFWQSQDFYNNILIHIEYMIRRMETGYEVKNPILSDIKKRYPYAYEISMLLVPIIYRYKNYYIPDDEIAYIAIFVEHFMENVNRKLRTVVISSARFSASTIVSNWLETNFKNQIEVTAMIPLHNLEQYLEENQVDLIVSTADSVMHPVINTFNIQGIPDKHTQTAMNALVHKIRMNYRFREIIREHIRKNNIRIYTEKTTFQDVITDLAVALKSDDCIYDVEEYVNDVIQREVNYPTYIGDWFMIPHPLMTFAKKTAIGVAVMKKPLHVHHKEIQLIFLLAMEKKQNDQVGALFHFFKHIALEKSSIGMLAAVETEEEFLDMLIKISNYTEFD